MRIQLQAGFILDAIHSHLRNRDDSAYWASVLQQLCAFEFETDSEVTPQEPDPLVLVADNIVSRGTPTLASCFVEDAFAVVRVADTDLGLKSFDGQTVSSSDLGNGSTTGGEVAMDEMVCPPRNFSPRSVTERSPSLHTGTIRYPLTDTRAGFLEAVEDAFAIIDPRVRPQPLLTPVRSWEEHLSSEFEDRFHVEEIPRYLGEYAFQLLHPQREFATLLKFPGTGRQSSTVRRDFVDQRVDFAVQFPQYPKAATGLVIEIDGSQHEDIVQKELDRIRDQATRSLGWHPTLRIKTSEVGQTPAAKVKVLRDFFEHPHAQRLRRNYEEPQWHRGARLAALQLALSPLGIARIQKAVLHLLRCNVLSLDAPQWNLAVIERDVPCARLALTDLMQTLRNLAALRDPSQRLPEVQLRVFATREFMSAALRCHDEAQTLDGEVEPFDADALLDVSVLQRPGFSSPSPELCNRISAKHVVLLRSAHCLSTRRRVGCARPIQYNVPEDVQPGTLVYFLQNIFRKNSFREGQVSILRRALAGQSTIALLPTGAGKSLTYQMATLLQPGIALVIDPLKSLMRDQDDNLRRQGIDSTVFVNNSLKAEERRLAVDEIAAGRYHFAFVSPERLMIDEFRDHLRCMDARGTGFCYVVVDEAHCVSEWGHDFRPAYLRLGRNARKYCHTMEDRLPIPILALTGTASFDVLADVQRELEILDDNAIVAPQKFEREELEFQIIAIEPPELMPRKTYEAGQVVAEKKQDALIQALAGLPTEFGIDRSRFFSDRDEQTQAGLIFAPHATGRSAFGVVKLAGLIRQEIPELRNRTSHYSGGQDGDDPETSINTQRAYKQNQLSLLVATKAFGMGIDKPNIRYTIHFSMPASIESFYQEAGRAGRDREKARCIVLYSPALQPDNSSEPAVTVDKGLMLSFHHNSFKGEVKEKRILFELLSNIRSPNSDTAPGIEKLLGAWQDGNLGRITIPFENDGTQRLADYLSKKTEQPWTPTMVSDAMNFRSTPEEFLRKVNSVHKNSTGQWLDTSEPTKWEALDRLFWQVRTQEDTFRAVYRLSVVGAIDDYSVDYTSRLLIAVMKKEQESHYLNCLQVYVSRYVSVEEANRVATAVAERKGDTLLQKCLGYLVDFVYKRIVARRCEAMDVMEEALRAGVESGSTAFAQYVNTYFDSRVTPELRPYLYEYNQETVWRFMERTGGEKDAVSHLRGACNRLLVENPDNGALLLLRAFTTIAQGAAISVVPNDFLKGLQAFESKEQLGRDAMRHVIDRFFGIAAKFDRGAIQTWNKFIVDWHTTWLREFNQQLALPRRVQIG